MNLGQNGRGIQLPVPDLAAAAGPQPAQWVQANIIGGAGITPGGRGVVVTAAGETVVADGFDVPVMATPGWVAIVGVTGLDADGQRVLIPWHAVRGLHP